MSGNGMCNRDCVFRNTSGAWACDMYGCRYLEITKTSRVKAVYDLLGIKEMNNRARELLHPESCPLYQREKVEKPKEPKKSKQKVESKVDEVRLRELWESGLSDAEIGKVFGVASTCIWKRRKKLGLPTKYDPQKNAVNWQRARQLYHEGKKDAEIAAEIGCAPRTVKDWRGREGLYRRRSMMEKE